MRLYEKLLQDIKETERAANDGLFPPMELKRVEQITVHPDTFHDLLKEQEEVLKENKDLPPFIHCFQEERKFFGIPLVISPAVDQWKIYIV